MTTVILCLKGIALFVGISFLIRITSALETIAEAFELEEDFYDE